MLNAIRRSKQISSIIIFLLFFSTELVASTYTCDAVDEIAKLGYDGGSSVSVFEKGKQCSFSIGGARLDGMEADTYGYPSGPRSSQSFQDEQILSYEFNSPSPQRLSTILQNHLRAHKGAEEFLRKRGIQETLSNTYRRIECSGYRGAESESYNPYRNEEIPCRIISRGQAKFGNVAVITEGPMSVLILRDDEGGKFFLFIRGQNR